MEIAVRIVVIYLFILAGLRVLGKREFGQLSPIELVALLLISEIVSPALTADEPSLTAGLFGGATLLVLVFLISLLSHRFKTVERITGSDPTVLAHNGKLLRDRMDRERVSAEELYGELRKAGLERIDQVRWAVLESDGSIAIIPLEQQEVHEQPEQALP